MKRVKSKRSQKQKEKLSAATSNGAPPTELSSFSLAAEISQQQQTQPRKIFGNIASPLRKSKPSQVSIATSTSFATANENEFITPAASYFVDSSDDETQETNDPGYNDLLAVLSSNTTTPTEISFDPTDMSSTMPSKKSTKKITPVVAEATTTAAVVPPKKTVSPVAATKPDPTGDEAHFDVAQNVYGAVKDAWAWGTTLPVVSNFLGITEAVAAKVVETTVHMDLPAIDQEAVTPQLKNLDDAVITPAILAVWKIIEPAVGKTDEMIIKPVLKEVVPRVLAPLSIFDSKKKEEKEAMAAPAIVPALN